MISERDSSANKVHGVPLSAEVLDVNGGTLRVQFSNSVLWYWKIETYYGGRYTSFRIPIGKKCTFYIDRDNELYKVVEFVEPKRNQH